MKGTVRRGFTIVELMVVVGIIAVLITILIPVISRARIRAHDADTKNFVMQLTAAINRYEQDFHAYPGPLAESQIFLTSGITVKTAATNYDTTWSGKGITEAENLTLGLLGGLKLDTTSNPATVEYDPTLVGNGPMSLNVANPKRAEAYIDSAHLSWRDSANGKTGRFQDAAASAADTIIPEFVDTYPGAEMPILYLRARRGVPSFTGAQTATANPIITNNVPGTVTSFGTYDLTQIIAYTAADANSHYIGVGKKPAAKYTTPPAIENNWDHGLRTVDPTKSLEPQNANYQYPFDAYPYLVDPSMPGGAQKDSYILISAGPDRIYGTKDDIVSFGDVGQ